MPEALSTRSAADRAGELAGLLDGLLDPLFLIAADTGLITDCNAAALRWQSCERSALVGQSFRILLPAATHECRHDLLEQMRVYGHVFMEQPFALRAGQVVRADLSASFWRRAAGDVIVLVLRDAEPRLATQRLETEARLAAARLETISRLSHEINNELQALLMHEGPEFDEAARDRLDRIVAVMRRMRAEVTAPVAAEAVFDEPPATAPCGQPTPCDSRRILVADDSDSVRQSLSLLLRQALPDAVVDLVDNGEDAVACFGRTHPAVIVLDILMPRKTGDQAFAEILAICRQEGWEEPRIVFCTGYTLPPSIQAALVPPSRHLCLLKPVSPRDLLAAVAGLVAAARTPRD